MRLGSGTRYHPRAVPGHRRVRPEGPLLSRYAWPPSSSEPITRRASVPPVPGLALLRLPPRPRSFSRETGSSIRSTRRRAGRRAGAGSPEMLAAQSFFSPRVRGVQGRFSGEFTGNMAGRSDRLCGERPLGAGLLRCEARLVEDACHHDRGEAPLRSRGEGRLRHVSPSRSTPRCLPFCVALLSPCPPPCGAVSQRNRVVNSGNPPSSRGTPGRAGHPPFYP